MNLLAALCDLERSRKPAALCTVVKASGSTPRKAGAKMLVILRHQGTPEIIGTIGGGAIEYYIANQAVEAITNNQNLLLTTSLRNDLAMCCGGEMTVFIEALHESPILVCFGAGHIAQALCPLAHTLGFSVHVYDQRHEFLALAAFNSAHRSNELNNFAFMNMPWGSNTYVVVTTHDHALDQQIIENALSHEYKYLSLVGSERKALMTKKRLSVKGFSEERQQSIRCPAGLAISAQTPQEIALSIMAQIIQVKHEAQHMRPDRSSRAEPPHGLPQSLEAHQG